MSDAASNLDQQAALTVASGFRFQWEPSQSGYVLLYPEGMITLNDSAAEILKLCDGRTAREIVEALSTQFPDADLEADVLEFLEEAHERGWIQYV